MISVLTSPLFTVRNANGTEEHVGLRQLIENAHEYRDIETRTPTGRCALIRLIIALLEDIYRPEDLEDRQELYESGRFDMVKFDDYIAQCEKDGSRFLLDDPKHPFMQMPFDSKIDEKAEKPIAALTFDVPSGNNHIHLDHRHEEELALSAAEAFETLLETYMFCPAGLSGPSSLNNTPPVYFLLHGNNLFEILALNMISAEELNHIPFGESDVPWRLNRTITPRETVSEMNYLRALTWMPRRVTLCFEENGMVRRCWLQPGLDFRGDGRWYDPQVAYFLKKDNTWGTLKPEQGRHIWRNVSNILAGMGKNSIQPTAIANLGEICDEELVHVDAVGMKTNQAACLGWSSETLCLPKALLTNEAMANHFCQCVDKSEILVRRIEKEVEQKLSFGSERRKKYDHQAAEQACELFLQIIHDELFDHTMDRILNKQDDWRSAFAEAVRGAVRQVMETVVNRSGQAVEMMKRQEDIRGILMWAVNKEMEGW